jgi:hypothetical protein
MLIGVYDERRRPLPLIGDRRALRVVLVIGGDIRLSCLDLGDQLGQLAATFDSRDPVRR